MKTSLENKLEYNVMRLKKVMTSKVFTSPLQRINDEYVKVDKLMQTLLNVLNSKIKDNKIKLVKNIAKLDTLSPLKTLTRGYSITESKGKIVKYARDLKTGDEINIRFQDGIKNAIINDNNE